MKISNYVSGAVRQFSYWFAHGTLGNPLLEGIDYLNSLKDESSFAEQAYAIFMNNLEIDADGCVVNYKHCEDRAAQFIKSYFDSEYTIFPPLENWETELHPVSKKAYQL